MKGAGGRRPPELPARGQRRRRAQFRRTVHGNVREAAAWVLERTLSSLAPAETFLDGARARCDERDHGLLSELVYGTLRWMRRLDYIIERASDRKLERIETPLLAPLRLGAYQLLFLDRVPPHAVVHEAVEQATHLTHRGGGRFVNAVLRRIARSPRLDQWPVDESDPVKRMAIELSHPDFLVSSWLERFGERRTRRLLEANNRAKPLHLLAFRDRGGREILAEELIDEGLEVEPSALSSFGLKVLAGRPWLTKSYARGAFYVQDEASQLAALLPPPAASERVLDVAAAPGGKTLSLISWEPSVRCVACDASLSRALLLEENLRRLDRSVPVLVADGARPAVAAVFDRVIVDLPCSGTGTLRRKPELKWRLSPAEIDRLAIAGAALIRGAARAVAEGGLLVVMTCSIEKEENEDIVTRFLDDHPDFVPGDLTTGLQTTARETLEAPHLWRLLPGGDHDGFTVQALRRTGSKTASEN